jgi:predicted O-methyltransferase YrrM
VNVWNGAAVRYARYRLGLVRADTQTTAAEQACLARHAAGRRQLVEIGVMHGATTALLRSVMASDGVITGIDRHPPGRLFVSFERLTAKHELARHSRGRAVLLREWSHEAARHWTTPVDFLFIDGDHSWAGVERDWRDWTPHLVPGGLVALHDSRPMPDRDLPDSVRFTTEIVLHDARFSVVDAVDSLTVLERVVPTTNHQSPTTNH